MKRKRKGEKKCTHLRVFEKEQTTGRYENRSNKMKVSREREKSSNGVTIHVFGKETNECTHL